MPVESSHVGVGGGDTFAGLCPRRSTPMNAQGPHQPSAAAARRTRPRGAAAVASAAAAAAGGRSGAAPESPKVGPRRCRPQRPWWWRQRAIRRRCTARQALGDRRPGTAALQIFFWLCILQACRTTLELTSVLPCQGRPHRLKPTMEDRLHGQSARMAIYKDQALLDQARRCIPVARLESAARGGGSSKPAPAGCPGTKWLDFNKQPLEFVLAAPVAVDAWAFSTANDEPGRDPVRWVLEGSGGRCQRTRSLGIRNRAHNPACCLLTKHACVRPARRLCARAVPLQRVALGLRSIRSSPRARRCLPLGTRRRRPCRAAPWCPSPGSGSASSAPGTATPTARRCPRCGSSRAGRWLFPHRAPTRAETARAARAPPTSSRRPSQPAVSVPSPRVARPVVPHAAPLLYPIPCTALPFAPAAFFVLRRAHTGSECVGMPRNAC